MRLVSGRVAVVVIAVLIPQLQAAEPLPRYKLQAGQHLTYVSDGETTYEGGSIKSSGTLDVYVTAVRPDGPARVVVLTSTTTNNDTSQEVISYTVFPDGRITFDQTPTPDMPGTGIFPLLPPTADSQTWKSEPDLLGTVKTYTRGPTTRPGMMAITSASERPENKIYRIADSTTDYIDTARGLLDHGDSTVSQDNEMHAKGTGSTRLTAVEQLDAEALARFSADAEACMAAINAYRETLGSVEKDPKLVGLLSSADRPLKEAVAKIGHPAVKGLLTARVAQHERDLPYIKESAEKRAALLNKPVPDFSTTDYGGKAVKLSDLRGKVVLLDFWYRGCGWCVRAMPQLKQVADDFRGQPVAILGMNTDRDPEDARFVIKEMALNYPTLKAEGYPEKLGVHAFPTLVLIDRRGVIRDVQEGWSPTLRKDVGDKIRELLKGE